MEEITMKKLRAGIVGCGGIANAKHLPAMEKCGLYEVYNVHVTAVLHQHR